MNRFLFCIIVALFYSCSKNEKAKIVLGMELGGNLNAQIDSGYKYGMSSNKTDLLYFPTKNLTGIIIPAAGYNDKGEKILLQTEIIFHNWDLPDTVEIPGYRFFTDFHITKADKETLIKLYEEKYGLCEKDYLKEGKNGGFKRTYEKNEIYEWHDNDLIVNLHFTESKNLFDKFGEKYFSAEVKYRFIEKIEKNYLKNTEKFNKIEKKNKTNV